MIKNSVPKENKIIAKAALAAFGGELKVIKHWDEKDKSSIDILTVDDRPDRGLTSYSTIGLYNYPVKDTKDRMPLSVEFVGACDTRFKDYSNIIGTCAFNIINSGFTCGPGEVFKDVVKMYYKNTDMQHVMFAPPFLWEDKLQTLDLGNIKTAWLLVVPISNKELIYLDKNGSDALEDVFEQKQIDLFDLNRKSVF